MGMPLEEETKSQHNELLSMIDSVNGAQQRQLDKILIGNQRPLNLRNRLDFRIYAANSLF